MLVSNEDPCVFIFYENWRTKAEWDRHMKSPHLVAFAKRQGELAAGWKLFQMTRQPWPMSSGPWPAPRDNAGWMQCGSAAVTERLGAPPRIAAGVRCRACRK